MKKIVLLAAAFVVSVSAVSAQDFQWGAKAGLNLANISDVDDSKMRPGFHAGVFAEKVISPFFGVQAELLYSQMGMKSKVAGETNTSKADYLVLPVLAKLYVLEGLSVDLGPQFGYMISAKINDKKVYDDVDKKFDVSAAMGLSYKICDRFDVSARYNLGLTSVEDVEGMDDYKPKNNVIQVGVGYRF
jgi:opacity protein-like surface antigen